MNGRYLAMPWAPNARAYSLPGSITVKLRLGEAPGHVPTKLEVKRRVRHAASSLDGGAIDRLLGHYARDARISHVHVPAASLAIGSVAKDTRFNDMEQVTGLARTFRIDMNRGCAIANLIDALSQLATVEAASPQYLCTLPFDAPATPLDSAFAWETRDLIQAAEAMAYETGDATVVIAVVDTGIAPRHPELAGRWRAGYDTVQISVDDLAQGAALLGDHTRIDVHPIDEFVGHGMGCAGVIGALGAAMPPGLAGDCPLLPIRVLAAARVPGKDAPVGIGAIADIDCGMKMAVDLGTKVINMSFGTADSLLDPDVAKPHADVVRYALDRGCVLIAASGNSGAEEVYWPAAYEGVIAVGAVGPDRRPSRFSTRGDHVAVCAPGERIVTAALNGYQLATGTSFAAPFVTAAAGLMVSRAGRRSYYIDSAKVRDLLVRTASPFNDPSARGAGAGILNAFAALQALDREIDAEQPVDEQDDRSAAYA